MNIIITGIDKSFIEDKTIDGANDLRLIEVKVSFVLGDLNGEIKMLPYSQDTTEKQLCDMVKEKIKFLFE